MKEQITLNEDTVFDLWHKYIKIDQSKQLIITFIDNGVLDTDLGKEYFREIFHDFQNEIVDFYVHGIVKTARENTSITSENINYDINFEERLFEFSGDDNGVFNSFDFAFEKLNLLPEFEEKAIRSLK